MTVECIAEINDISRSDFTSYMIVGLIEMSDELKKIFLLLFLEFANIEFVDCF